MRREGSIKHGGSVSTTDLNDIAKSGRKPLDKSLWIERELARTSGIEPGWVPAYKAKPLGKYSPTGRQKAPRIKSYNWCP